MTMWKFYQKLFFSFFSSFFDIEDCATASSMVDSAMPLSYIFSLCS